MNNKGQTLVVFVIILPIFFMMLSLIINLEYLTFEKSRISKQVINSLDYYLNENKAKSDLYELLNENIKDADIVINEYDNYIEVKVAKEFNNIGISLDNNIEIIYKGYYLDKKIVKG